MKFRVGFGFDVHQLKEGIPFILGGVAVPHTKGALGHSDADVVIHAICDALLGAAGLKDIGFYFPDTSAEFKGIDSKILLQRVMILLKEKETAMLVQLFEKGVSKGELKPLNTHKTAELFLDTLYAFSKCVNEKGDLPDSNAFTQVLNRQQGVTNIFYQGLKSGTWAKNSNTTTVKTDN